MTPDPLNLDTALAVAESHITRLNAAQQSVTFDNPDDEEDEDEDDEPAVVTTPDEGAE